MLKTFLVYLSYMPEDKIESINGKEIKNTGLNYWGLGEGDEKKEK